MNKDFGWMRPDPERPGQFLAGRSGSGTDWEKKQNEDLEEMLSDLKGLKAEFSGKADYYGRRAASVASAIERIEEGKKLKTEKAQEQVALFKYLPREVDH